MDNGGVDGGEAGNSNVATVEALKVQASSAVKDFEKLLQDMDVNRLRAVIYRWIGCFFDHAFAFLFALLKSFPVYKGVALIESVDSYCFNHDPCKMENNSSLSGPIGWNNLLFTCFYRDVGLVGLFNT